MQDLFHLYTDKSFCLQHLDVFTEAQRLCDIFGVEDQSGMLLDKGIVNIGMPAGNHDEIGILQQLAAQLRFAGHRLAVFHKLGNPRIVIAHVCADLPELIDHTNSGAFTVVIDILLVGNA